MGKLTDSEVIKNVIEALQESANSFAVKMEYKSAASVYHVINGINDLSDGMMKRIVMTFPDVNYNYMKSRGEEGEPLLTESEKINQANMMNIPIPKGSSMIDIVQWMKFPDLLDKLLEEQRKTNEILSEILKEKQGAM